MMFGTRHDRIVTTKTGIKNMELRLLRYFLTVAKEQSFTKAAELM